MRKKTLLLLILVSNIFVANAQLLLTKAMKKVYEKPEQVCRLLMEGKGDSIVAMGNSQFKAAAKAEMFNDIIPTIEKQLGKYQSMESWTITDSQPGMKLYQRKILFENYSMPITVSFDSDGALAGLFFGAPKIIDNTEKANNERDITIETDGLKMPGRLTMPENRVGDCPCVILVHGSGPNNMNEAVGKHKPFLDLAEGLSRHGIAVIRYDKRTLTHGANSVPKDKKENYDTETVDDVLSAIALARNTEGIDANKIYVTGHSLGAMLSPRIAERDGHLAGIIALAAPARKMRELLTDQIKYLSNFADKENTPSKEEIDTQINNITSYLPKSYIDMDEAYSPVETASKLDIPILLLQGERDYQVTMKDYSIWKDYLGSHKNVSMRLYPKLNHLFTEGEGACTPEEYDIEKHIPDYIIKDIADFILQ